MKKYKNFLNEQVNKVINYKKGDQVICTYVDNALGISINKIYTILEISGYGNLVVAIINDNNLKGDYMAYRFKKYADIEFKDDMPEINI